MAQIVYYFWAGLQLGAPQRVVNFNVPSGNFGNVFAGYAARKMGLPIDWLAWDPTVMIFCFGFLNKTICPARMLPSLAPSMDIQVSSNFERCCLICVRAMAAWCPNHCRFPPNRYHDPAPGRV